MSKQSNLVNSSQDITVDASGHVTMPNQPRAMLYHPTTMSPVNNGDIVAFESTDNLTTDITVNASKSRLTVPTAGTYYVSFVVAGSCITPDAGDGVRLGINRNGSVYGEDDAHGITTTGDAAGEEVNFVGSILVELAASDYVELEFSNVGDAVFNVKMGNLSMYKIA